jgi:hypothetical protein
MDVCYLILTTSGKYHLKIRKNEGFRGGGDRSSIRCVPSWHTCKCFKTSLGGRCPLHNGCTAPKPSTPPSPIKEDGCPPPSSGQRGGMSVRWSPTTVPAVGPVKTVRWASRAAMLFFERRGTAHLGFRSFQRIRRAFVTMASALGRASKRRVLRSGQDLSFTLSGGRRTISSFSPGH